MGQVTEEPFVIYDAQDNNIHIQQKIWPVYELIKWRIENQRPFIVTARTSIDAMRQKYGNELIDELTELFSSSVVSVKI